jgi:hypothetical protein
MKCAYLAAGTAVLSLAFGAAAYAQPKTNMLHQWASGSAPT